MAKTSSERQAEYRARLAKDGLEVRLSTVVSVPSRAQLERVAGYFGISQRRVLEIMLSMADQMVQCHLHDQPDADLLRAYLDGEHAVFRGLVDCTSNAAEQFFLGRLIHVYPREPEHANQGCQLDGDDDEVPAYVVDR
jgi:hypothetical protein